jgi:hypothetical protein
MEVRVGSDSLMRIKRAGSAPHKPVLMLATLDLYRNGNDRLIPFAVLERRFQEIASALVPVKSLAVQEPFWRLRNDGIWDVVGLESELGATPSRAQLRQAGVAGGFSAEVYDEIRKGDIAVRMREIIDHYFQPNDRAALKHSLRV